jgi:NADH-quinone oxidoreductase subunit K
MDISLYVVTGLSLFVIGVLGFLARRSALIALMSLELMLNGTNLVLISFSRFHGNPDGGSLFLLIVLVAAAEAAIALSILVSLFRTSGSVDLDDFRMLKG